MILVAAFVAAALVAGPAEPRAAQDVRERLEAARAALTAGRAEEAERRFRALVAAEPDLPAAREGLAEAIAAQGRLGEAASVLAEAGERLFAAGAAAEAEVLVERAVRLAPEMAEPWLVLGRCRLALEAFAAAAADFERAVAAGGGTMARLYLGAALWEAGRIEEAEGVYRDAIAASRRDPVVLQQLGGLYLWTGRYEEAAALLGEAATRTRASADLYLELGRALEGAGRAEEALAVYRKSVLLAPEVPESRYNLAVLLARQGETETARRELEAFRRLREAEERRLRERKRTQARLDAARDALRRGRLDDATAAIAPLGEGPDVLAIRARIAALQGNAAAAIAALEKAVALAPDRHDLRLELARTRLAHGATP